MYTVCTCMYTVCTCTCMLYIHVYIDTYIQYTYMYIIHVYSMCILYVHIGYIYINLCMYICIIAEREARQIILTQCFLAWEGVVYVCMYVTLLRSKCTISYMQRTRGLTENTWHAQKKTFKRTEEMSHQELRTSTRLRVQRYRLAHQDERYLSF